MNNGVTKSILLCFSLIFITFFNSFSLKPSSEKGTNSDFFIENKGQWDNKVIFLSRFANLNAWITSDGLTCDFYKSENNFSSETSGNSEVFGHVIKMTFTNACPNHTSPSGFSKTSAYYNYFLGNDPSKWASYVSLFQEVTQHNIYQGIDIRYYFDASSLRYDFIVNPNADAGEIKLRFTGQDRLRINDNGDLVFKTSIGDMYQTRLFAYQMVEGEKQPVSCRFSIIKGEVGFQIGSYDKNKVLVIDPIIFSTFISTSGKDEIEPIIIDNNHNVYVSGTTDATTYPTTAGAYKTTYQNGSDDAFITKLNPTGSNLIFSTFIGGNGLDYGMGMVMDVSGNLYLTGRTFSTNFPCSASAYQNTNHGIDDIFVIKINPSGSSMIYSTYIGGTNEDRSTQLDIDAIGNTYITGWSKSTDFPTTTGAFQSTNNGNFDGVMVKLNASGSALVYSTYVGGSGLDDMSTAYVDNSGNFFSCGYTQSSNFPTTTGAYQTTNKGGYDGFFLKLNPTGTAMVFSSMIGSTGNDYCRCLSVDMLGNILLSGGAGSNNFPTTAAAYQKTFKGGGSDAFISKFTPSGNTLLYSSYLGGSGSEDSRSILVDKSNNIYVAGITGSSDFPITGCVIQSSYAGGTYDLFISKLDDKLSNLYYSTFLGGNGFEHIIFKTVMDDSNNIYIGGRTLSTNYPITPGAYQSTALGGTYDAMVTKLRIDTLILITGSVPVDFCLGAKFKIPYTTSCDFNAGNIFTAQISDSNGNFTSPVNIGTINRIKTDTILGTIPLNLIPGSGYRVRVISSSPFVTGTSNLLDITIHPSPLANWQVNDSIQCISGNNFIFNNTSSISNGSLISYWTFGDGFFSNTKNPSHNYSATGTYKVSLRTTSSFGCIDSVKGKVYVISDPIAVFSINDTDQCLSYNKFIFTNTSDSNNATILWNFGDGYTSTQYSPVHSYKISGNFDVKMVINSGGLCKDSLTKKVYIHPDPSASFSINDSIQCFPGNSFIFNNASGIPSGSMNFNWSFGDGNSVNSTSPTYSYAASGVFNVTLIATSTFGCADTLTAKVYVIPKPTAVFTINDSVQCILKNKFLFNSSSDTTASIFKWDFGDGYLSTLINPDHSYISTGTYNIKLTIITSGFCKDSITKKATVNPGPVANFDINDTIQCLSGNKAVFNNISDTSAGNISYLWDFGDGFSSGSYHTYHQYTKAGIYTVKFGLSSALNCSDTLVRKITILQAPVADFNFPDSIQCLDINNFVFSNNSDTSIGNVSFYWDFGDGTYATTFQVNHRYTSPGNYTIKLLTTAGTNCDDSIFKKVTVTPNSTADFTTDTSDCLKKITFFNSSVNATKYLWDFGDGKSSENQNPVHQYSKPGQYKVLLTTNKNIGCQDTTAKIISVGDGLNNLYIPNVFTPNEDGLNEIFKVSGWDYNCEKYDMLIYNRWGEILYDSKDKNGEPYWDGYYKGKQVSAGVYIFILLGKEFTRCGTVTVLY